MNAFIEARNAAISSIPVRPGSKVPAIAWKGFQSEICSELEATEWGNGDSYGIGLITGEVSGRLMCIDIEARFMPRIGELVEALKADECYATFYGWVGGYCEETPSGGMHVLVRLEGSGPCPPNERFAMAADGVLIETRGEGGYVVVAPTPGWKLTHGGFTSIAYATLEEWETVVAVLSSFDATPQVPAPPPTVPTVPPILRLGDSWIDAAKAALPSIRTVLSSQGWEPDGRRDDYGEHWVRPGKDARQGHSASISENDLLWMHSTSLAWLPPSPPSYDATDLLLAPQLGRPPSLAERTEYLRRNAQRPPAATGAGAAPAVDVAELNLPLEFWESRPLLDDLRRAATLRGLAPAAVLGAFLSGYATTVPMGIWLPGVWGHRSPLNTYCALVARSGGGKTAAMATALDLLGWNVNTNPHVLLSQSIRSGEGMVTLVVRPRRKDDDDAPSFNNAIQVHFDEGGVLGKQAERVGTTTIPYLNTAWAGSGMVGGAKAGEISQFPASLVRVCCVMGVQFGAAANLFTGESARLGFPQRLLYFGLEDADLAALDVDTMDVSDAQALDVPFWAHSEFTRTPMSLHVPPDVVHEVRLWTRNKDHGPGGVDPLDGHMMLLRLRTAALLALLDGRGALNDEDWSLSAQLVDYSRQIRNSLVQSLQDISQSASRARIYEAVSTAEALEDRWVRTRAARVARFVHSQEEPSSMKDIRKRLASDEKRRIDEILDYATSRGWVIHRVEGLFEGGESRPS